MFPIKLIKRTNRKEFEGGGTNEVMKPNSCNDFARASFWTPKYRRLELFMFSLIFAHLISNLNDYVQLVSSTNNRHEIRKYPTNLINPVYPILHQKPSPRITKTNPIASDHRLMNKLINSQQLKRINSKQRESSGPDAATNRHYLPNGPPPFRPSSLLLGLNSLGALDKLKRTTAFKKMYKSKVYYLFLDVLHQLTLLVEKLSRKKMDFAQSKMELIQIFINKFALKSGQSLKLKWPLALLNPHFVREILSSPTFLVMLFHAVEVAYTSLPINFFLKPLVKLVAQPSAEKEEKIWWRRKRIYDTLNGHGSSELQPNLRSTHFRHPGRPTPIAIPKLVSLIRQIHNKPAPNPTYYRQPVDIWNFAPLDSSSAFTFADHQHQQEHNNDLYMNVAQEEAFLANQIKPHDQKQLAPSQRDRVVFVENGVGSGWKQQEVATSVQEPHEDIRSQEYTSSNNEEWLAQMPSPEQLMSQQEFDSLESQEKEKILEEAKRRLEESKWTNQFIKQHSDLIDSFSSTNTRIGAN